MINAFNTKQYWSRRTGYFDTNLTNILWSPTNGRASFFIEKTIIHFILRMDNNIRYNHVLTRNRSYTHTAVTLIYFKV